jgi:hypothetical protein
MDLEEIEVSNDCAGEGQQQFSRPTDIICFVKPVLTEDLYIVHEEEFSMTCYMCDTYI